MSRATSFRVAGFLLALLGAACGGDPVARLSRQERVDRLQNLLIRGVAHAEIDEWPQAIELFEQALPLAEGDPVVAYGLAVAHFKNGEPEAAREWLDRIDVSASAELHGRAAYLEGKLALGEGDAQGEAAAYRRAMEIDPAEPAYPYSLTQVVPRIGGAAADDEVGRLLDQAANRWPDNGRIGAELAQWLLGRPETEMRQRGADLVVELGKGQPDVEALVERGLEELAANPDKSPVSLRRALNLLRPGKRFQTDSALLESRLAVLPLARPVAAGLSKGSVPSAAAITFEPAPLLPDESLPSNATVLQIELSNDAVADAIGGRGEADLALLTEEAVWFVGHRDESIEPITLVDGTPGQILVGELDGDGWMEIVLLTDSGVRLFGRTGADAQWEERSLEPALAASGGLRSALLIDFEHDGDLDLLATDTNGNLVLVTHRGEAGLGAPEPAPLPATGPVDFIRSVDLDGDVDLDLILAGGGAVQILTNWRQGEFRAGKTLSAPEGKRGFTDLLGLDYNGDGRFDLVGAADGALAFFVNEDPGGLVIDESATENASRLVGGERVDVIGAADMDLDGALDLLLVHTDAAGESSLSFLRAQDGPGLGGRVSLKSGMPFGVTAVDLDGDHDPDPIVWGDTGITTARSTGAEAQGWLRLVLRGLAGKVPLDGRGATVEVSFGLDRRVYAVERPEVVVGLGGRTPALVNVTWPNGISEFLFQPQPDAQHVIEQELRIEGSCPFLYASDGSGKRFVTDILGLAPLGMLAGPGRYVPADPEEYLRLPDWVAAEGAVELSITEELREVAYLDQVELVVVDAPADVEVYNGERWIEGTITGLDLRLLSTLRAPVSVKDDRGREVLDVVARRDERYLTNHDGERLYQGAVPMHRLEIEIPDDLAASGRAALVLSGWLHWGNTSTNLARAQDPQGAPVFPYVEVPISGGSWRRVDLDVGLPAGKTKPVVVDLSGIVDAADPRIRITTDFEVYWDQIAVAALLPPATTSHRTSRLAPSAAELSYGGFSRWYRPAENGPYLFDYADRQPVPWRHNSSGLRPIAWQEHEGFYTGFGRVDDLVAAADDALVVFGAGEELALSFDTEALPALPEGWKRTLFLHSEGWEKDGDPNVACGQTVGPLPGRGIAEYPCSGITTLEEILAPERSPGMDRWVGRHRLERRVAAWAEVR